MRGMIVKAGDISRRVAGTGISVLLCVLAALAQQKSPASASAAPVKSTPAASKPAQKTKPAGKASAPKAPDAAKAAAPTPEAEKSGKNRDPFRTLIVEK